MGETRADGAELWNAPLPSSVKPSEEELVRPNIEVCMNVADKNMSIPPYWMWEVCNYALQLESRLAAARLSVREGEWRPMSEAPRKGEAHILLHTTDHGWTEAWFWEGRWVDHHEGRESTFVEAFDRGHVQLASEEIPGERGTGFDDFNGPSPSYPPHPWHEEWLVYVRETLAKLPPSRKEKE